MASLNQAQQVQPVTAEEPKTPGQISGYESFYRMFTITTKRLHSVDTWNMSVEHQVRLEEIKVLMFQVEKLMNKE